MVAVDNTAFLHIFTVSSGTNAEKARSLHIVAQITYHNEHYMVTNESPKSSASDHVLQVAAAWLSFRVDVGMMTQYVLNTAARSAAELSVLTPTSGPGMRLQLTMATFTDRKLCRRVQAPIC